MAIYTTFKRFFKKLQIQKLIKDMEKGKYKRLNVVHLAPGMECRALTAGAFQVNGVKLLLKENDKISLGLKTGKVIIENSLDYTLFCKDQYRIFYSK